VRCLEPEYNRGIEAARAAVNMSELFARLNAVTPAAKANG